MVAAIALVILFGLWYALDPFSQSYLEMLPRPESW